MNFYASPEYLSVVSEVYFPGQRTAVEDVRIGDEVLRLLVVDGKKVITSLPFLDYHQPLTDAEKRSPSRKHGFAASVSRRVIEHAAWDRAAFRGFTPAPYVDWSKFTSYDAYQEHIRPRGKDLLREAARRRRRLADTFGYVSFCRDDTEPDVFEAAKQWKSAQLRETGLPDYFQNPQNIEFFHALRRKGKLTTSTLRAGGRLLSLWMGFIHEGVWSGWIFTYNHDPDLRKYSVGRQLLHSMLEESYHLKHREFDFSTGDEDYKWLYATNARVLGPLGHPPLQQRIINRAKTEVKRALSRYPEQLETLRQLSRKLRESPLLERLKRP